MMARTDPQNRLYKGLSTFVIAKPAGTTEAVLPPAHISGAELGVRGRRGMKEYEISLDGRAMGAETLLGAQNPVGSRN